MSAEHPGLAHPALVRVLEAAARLQELVPDAVLVGGSAAALHAGHRDSYDHVLSDLADRLDAVLEAVESQEGWVTNRVTPGKIILGELGGIETGIRQLIRRTPLELALVRGGPGRSGLLRGSARNRRRRRLTTGTPARRSPTKRLT